MNDQTKYPPPREESMTGLRAEAHHDGTCSVEWDEPTFDDLQVRISGRNRGKIARLGVKFLWAAVTGRLTVPSEAVVCSGVGKLA